MSVENSGRSNSPASRPVCMISGGSSGIGLATALKFAEQGYRIAICGRRERPLADAAERIVEIGGSPDCVFTLAVDFGDPDQAKQFGGKVLEHWGRIDVLVNNAAAAPLAPFEEITATDFESTVNINVRSLFYLTQLVWGSMKRQAAESVAHRQETHIDSNPKGTSVVVNISSMAAVDPFAGFSVYGASKAWLDLLTQALAAEGQPLGLRVYSIRPGAVETPLLRSLFPDFPAEECTAPEAVAELVWNCVSQPKKYSSGKAFLVNQLIEQTDG